MKTLEEFLIDNDFELVKSLHNSDVYYNTILNTIDNNRVTLSILFRKELIRVSIVKMYSGFDSDDLEIILLETNNQYSIDRQWLLNTIIQTKRK